MVTLTIAPPPGRNSVKVIRAKSSRTGRQVGEAEEGEAHGDRGGDREDRLVAREEPEDGSQGQARQCPAPATPVELPGGQGP